MAKIKGEIRGAKGVHYSSASRLSNSHMVSYMNTWRGNIETVLREDGSCSVTVNGETVFRGNVNG